MFASVSLHAIATILLPLAVIAAEEPTLTVSRDLRVGDTAKIEYCDPSRAGQTIKVVIDNGMQAPESYDEDVIFMVLDEKGKATAHWRVPDWYGANFNAPGVPEEHRTIL